MKRLKQSQLLHIWEEYEFFLNTSQNFNGSNKPSEYFYYFDVKTNKTERIRRYVSKNKGELKKIWEDAKALIKDFVELLKTNWNPLINELARRRFVNKLSIKACY